MIIIDINVKRVTITMQIIATANDKFWVNEFGSFLISSRVFWSINGVLKYIIPEIKYWMIVSCTVLINKA